MVNVRALIAIEGNVEGYREILGIDVTTAEDRAGWLTFWRSLSARGCDRGALIRSMIPTSPVHQQTATAGSSTPLNTVPNTAAADSSTMDS